MNRLTPLLRLFVATAVVLGVVSACSGKPDATEDAGAVGGGSGGAVGGGAGGSVGGGAGGGEAGGAGGGVGGGGGSELFDAGEPDSGKAPDSGEASDAGIIDAGTDAGVLDAGTPDAGPFCSVVGAYCADAGDCCSGVCLETAKANNGYANVKRCGQAPIAACKADGTLCAVDRECCTGQCFAGVCEPQSTPCAANLAACSDDTDCCASNSCNISNNAGVQKHACLTRQQQANSVYPGFACGYTAQCYSSSFSGGGVCITPADGGVRTCSNGGNVGCGGTNDYCSAGSCCAGLTCLPGINRCYGAVGSPCDSSGDCAGSCNPPTGLCE